MNAEKTLGTRWYHAKEVGKDDFEFVVILLEFGVTLFEFGVTLFEFGVTLFEFYVSDLNSLSVILNRFECSECGVSDLNSV